MPQSQWSEKRERQYEHVTDSVKKQGRPAKVAKEIAARTVNKERARRGESKETGTSSSHDFSSGRRGGLRSHSGPSGRTRDQLYQEAQKRKIQGRSSMTKPQLQKALGER